MIKNRFREALLQRTPTFGAWIQIGHPAIAEIFGRVGFDWIAVDLEHGAIDLATMTDIFRTIERYGAAPVARLPYNDAIWIKRTLDAGARGLIVPMVNTVEQARSAVNEAKYPPLGRRGYGYSRANLHGLDFTEYISTANEEIALIMQIEHREGIDNVEEILSVPGVDAGFIGPLDLSGSYGKTGQLDAPEVVAALTRFLGCCAHLGKSAGMHVVHPGSENLKRALADGYTMVAVGMDNVLLAGGAQVSLAAAQTQAVCLTASAPVFEP